MNKIDNQPTAMAGEFLTAGKLFKLGLQVSITVGNAKSIDLFVYNEKTGHTYPCQVKTLRNKNCFDLKVSSVDPEQIFVFVFLHDFCVPEEFFIVPGKTLLNDKATFWGASITASRQTVNYGPLKPYKNNWEAFK